MLMAANTAALVPDDYAANQVALGALLATDGDAGAAAAAMRKAAAAEDARQLAEKRDRLAEMFTQLAASDSLGMGFTDWTARHHIMLQSESVM